MPRADSPIDKAVDLLRRKATRAGRRLDLTTKEFNLLTLLLRRQGEVVVICGPSGSGKTSLLRTLVRRRDFGVVSDSPGTTRHVESIDLHIDGASAVMATMDRTNEGTAGSQPFREAFAFYPGCGLINEFGGNASSTDKTTWLSYAPVTIHHAATDPLYTDGKCANRVSVAQTLGAGTASGNAVAMTVHAGARHSFDQVDLAKAIASPYTQADKDAQIAADAAVMDRLAAVFGN